MGSHWRFTMGLTAVGLVLFTAAGGCAAGAETEDEGTGAGGDSPTTVGMGGSGAMVGTGGDDGGGGAGGDTGLCDVDCSTISTPQCSIAVCNDGMYPGTVGECVVVSDDNGVPCDDGAFCTIDDSCQDGVCVGGGANDCGMVPSQCNEVTCDETSGTCSEQAAADGWPCDENNLCIQGSQCSGGVCTGGSLNDCFFAPVPDDCHVAVCNPANGMCEPVPGNDGQSCIDSNDLCTINKVCNGGLCDGGVPKDCSQLTMGCDLGVCDMATGNCTTQAVMNGQMCDDLDACTTGEICTSGMCGGGTAVTNCSQTGDGCCPMNCTALDDIDCACSSDSLVAPYNRGNGLDGAMFDVVAKSNAIEVQGFDVSIASVTTTIEIYYRPGTHVGFEESSAGWTLAGSAMVTGAGLNMPTPVPVTLSINIPAGQTYGFYVTTTTSGMDYTNGTALGNVLVENADLQILEGTGKNYPFGTSTITPREFNGTIYYEACGS